MFKNKFAIPALKILVSACGLFLVACSSMQTGTEKQAVSDHFDLTHWKIQFPGTIENPKPGEAKPRDLTKFSNEYFYLDQKTKNIVFTLDATAPGSTTNSPFVRSEFREEIISNEDGTNWSALEGSHELNVELKVGVNTLTENKVTVVQVHGGQKGGFTLLRAVFEDKDLVVYYKADNTKLFENRINFGPGYYNDYTKFNVKIENKRMVISLNGEPKLDVGIAYWNWPSYFKAGAYPQTNKPGKVSVMIKSIAVTHTNPVLIVNP